MAVTSTLVVHAVVDPFASFNIEGKLSPWISDSGAVDHYPILYLGSHHTKLQ